MTSERQCGACTRISWRALDDERITIEVESPLAAAPGILKNLERAIRTMAQVGCPEALAVADAINALADEQIAKARGEG